ncbi:MAG TPA: hypothetical protein VGB77_15400 [Abditibacteriaceae bacterium]|jgi:hypothetical protein
MKFLDDASYKKAIEKTAAMTRDGNAQKLAKKHGLQILNVTWEDTGRYKGSAVGPNISDMTIQVVRNPEGRKPEITCMPVIRFPNFRDKSADLDPRDFTLLAGNHRGEDLKRISLYDFLENPTEYLSEPDSWKADKKSLLAERDSQVLVSAQACFLPIPKQGKATFNPVLFNYQSYEENPAVLTVLATREGASVTVIDNKRDAFESGAVWGQRLFHNQNGQRASLTGERESEFCASNNSQDSPSVGNDDKSESGLNMVLLIQIPLKQKERPQRAYMACEPMIGAVYRSCEVAQESDVENAVIGHGDLEGPFTEIDNLAIERDERFPVRVTVQFYKATSNGVVSESDMKEIAAQIKRVYAQSDYVGSLVTEGDTGRITEYEGLKVQPPHWWADFWARHKANTGDSREEASTKLHELLGLDYQEMPVSDLYLRDVLKPKRR